jgi:multicomponent K+:H+ antiporter subunit G
MSYLAGVLVVLGALLVFTGSLGLVTLKTFYERVHPPTMGTTLGTGLMLVGSMLYFTALDLRPVLHEALIGIFMTLSTPVTYMVLLRAAILRDRAAGRDPRAASDAAAGRE